jgi:ATP-dependent Lon protease
MFDIQKHLNAAVYGHDEAKNVILELIGQWITNPNAIPQVIALQGPPGNGKTSLAKDGIAKALGRPFRMISLGGATDASYLDGHGFTYEGSVPGRVVSILQEAQCMNPVIFFDELDKVSSGSKGQEIIGALTHLTDHSQNNEWHDRYFSGIDFDLSKALIIFSLNDEEALHPVLKDRIRIIRTKGHDLKSKLIIAKDYMIPKIMENIKMEKENLIFEDYVINHIISTYANEEKGVRKLKQCIESIIMKINIINLVNKGNLDNEKPNIKFNIKDFKFPIKITNEIADNLIKDMKDNSNQPPPHMYI